MKDRRIPRAAILLALVLGLAATAGAWQDSEAAIAEWCRLSTDYETPHTKWGKPHAGGRLRVLYFIGSTHQGMDVRAREAVEFMQRFDAEVEVVYWINFYKPQWFGGVAGMRRIVWLLDKPWDLFVFQDVSPDKIATWPDVNGRAPHTLFIEAVRGGAGVVLTGCESEKYLKDRQAIDDIPSFLNGVPARGVWTFGKGRIVTLPERPVIPYRPGWQWRYDRWQEKLGRAALYAARGEPATRLAVGLGSDRIERSGLPITASFAWRGLTNRPAMCEAWLRREDGQLVSLGEPQVSAGPAGKVRFTVPKLRAGTYYVYGTLTSKRGREAWTTRTLEVTSPSRVAGIAVTSGARLPFVQVEKDKQAQMASEERLGTHLPYFESGQVIEGTVEVENAAERRLRIELLDLGGRILARHESAADGAAGFRYEVADWMPMAVRVRATIMEGNDEVAAGATFCRIVKRHRDRFNFVLWGGPADATLAPYALRTLKRMGVTAIYDRFPPSLAMARYDMAAVPFTGGRVHASRAEQWNDPQFARYWVNHVGRARSHGALAYSLGDEGATAGYGRGPKTLAAWRAYLRQTYPSVGALNTSWEADFASFDEIKDLRFKPGKPPTPLPNMAPAFDLAAFSGYNFVQMARIHVNALRKERDEPEAVIGFEGSGDFKRTIHAELICHKLGMWVPYAGYIDEFIRGTAPRAFLRSVWMGYHQTADGHCSRYYYALLNGADSAWYWMWSTMGAWQGFQKPDLAGGVPAVEAFLEDTRFVREGLGDLLLNYEMQTDGITMLYSEASNWLAQQKALPTAPYGPYRWAHLTWATAIQDLAMQYDYVSDRAVRTGKWDSSKTKILILSSALAISAETAKTLRAFVEDGGVVVADFRPGFYDHHGRPHDPGGKRAVLDELFGIRGTFPPEAVTCQKVHVTGEAAGVKISDFTSPNAEHAGLPLSDPGIEPAGAQALGRAGEAPVLLINQVGKGRAVLLNLGIWSMTPARNMTPNMSGQAGTERTPHPFGVFLKELFAGLGVEPPIEITPYKNKGRRQFVGNLRVQRWRSGENEIVAVFRQTGNRETAEKWINIRTFAGRRFVYDVRHGLPVGYGFGAKRDGVEGNWWVSDLVPSRASFFALTPSRLVGPELELPKTARRGQVLKAVIRVPNAKGLHAVKLRARTPDGRRFEEWEQTVVTDASGKAVRLPLAFNDPAGRWELVLTDCFSAEATTRRTLIVD